MDGKRVCCVQRARATKAAGWVMGTCRAAELVMLVLSVEVVASKIQLTFPARAAGGGVSGSTRTHWADAEFRLSLPSRAQARLLYHAGISVPPMRMTARGGTRYNKACTRGVPKSQLELVDLPFFFTVP